MDYWNRPLAAWDVILGEWYLHALGSSSIEDRRVAVEKLGLLRHRRAIERLLALVDADSGLIPEAVEALVRIGGDGIWTSGTRGGSASARREARHRATPHSGRRPTKEICLVLGRSIHPGKTTSEERAGSTRTG